MKRNLLLFALIFALAAPFAAAEDQKWLNIHVTETEDGADIKVHLPLTLVLSIMRGIDVDGFNGGRVHLKTEDVDIDWPQILASLKDAPDGEFVEITSSDADVTVRKAGGTLFINVDERSEDNATVEVTLPATIIDAIQIDDEDRIDIAALLQGFNDLPGGDLVRVTAPDANVRIWVE
jgi:hypothetical protein